MISGVILEAKVISMQSSMKTALTISAIFFALAPLPAQGQHEPFLDMSEMLDASTLKVEVMQDWHPVEGDRRSVATRQKWITIEVGELVPGKSYRIPVRMIVPAQTKAKGFHLTGGHGLSGFSKDVRPRGVDEELIRGGFGLVHTMVQGLEQSEQGDLGRASKDLFIETLNPRYSIQYWGWPATLMRAVTAALAEKDHFEPGKIAVSGSSKNGASPSVSIIYDQRMTALHSGVAPIWDSPLRLCDRKAWDELRAHNQGYAEKREKGGERNTRRFLRHPFLGGAFGPIYNDQALDAGHSWEDLRKLANRVADGVFIARNMQALKARDVDLYFHPGTHDFVAFDIAWGGAHHPEIPLYLGVNSGHGKRGRHPGRERDMQNKSAFLLEHFFEDVEPLLAPPSVKSRVEGRRLLVTVTFESIAETGRIFWMYDRGPDGSAAYINELFPEDQWKDMESEAQKKVWTAEIELESGASRIDFFTNHRKTIEHRSEEYGSYLSSPYTRVSLQD